MNTWLAAWLRKPRSPEILGVLGFRLLALVSVSIFGLLYGGLAAITGWDARGNPILGVLALVAGLALLALVIGYLRRPRRGGTDRAC